MPLNEDTPVDLLIINNQNVVRKCQCKYIYPTINGSHEITLCSIRKNGPNSKAFRHKYTEEEVDFFLGYCLDNDSVYVIPYEVTNGRQNLKLWILRNPIINKPAFDQTVYKNAFYLL